MDNGKSNIMMHRPQKVPISELNSCITCGLCKGYFIDATTIIECLHTFCRSCIVKYLKANKYCPICDVQVHKTKALLNIRQDKTLQALVYKLVPRLYQDEAKRRKAFYEANPAAKPSVSEQEMAAKFDYILAPDESVEFTLNYDGCSIKPRYIRCSSAVSITHLKKLIHSKYELTDRHKVDVFFKEDNLDSSLTLIDVAYIYSWKRKNPLDLTYKIYECRAKKPKLECLEGEENATSSTNWKEVQLRISENGEMSITGIQESGMLQLLEATEQFKSEVVIDESKLLEASEDPHSEPEQLKAADSVKKGVPDLLYFGKGANSAKLPSNNAKSVGPVTSEANHIVSSAATSTPSTSAPLSSEAKFKVPNLPLSKAIELSGSVNFNKELYVMPVTNSTTCVSLSCGSTTTVFSTISKSMCSTKSDDTASAMNLSTENRPAINPSTEVSVSSVLKQSNSLKRKCDEVDKTADLPTKLSKPTILNHSLGLLNLSNNHPLKKHSKILRTNGERKHADINDKAALSFPTPTITSEKSDNSPPKPIIINKSLNYVQMNRLSKLNVLPKNVSSGNVPCYMSKVAANSVGGKAHEKNGGRVAELSQDKSEGVNSRAPNAHSHAHASIITPAQLSHRHHLNALKQSVAEKPGADHSKFQNDLQATSDDFKESPVAEKAADAAEATIGGQQLDLAVSCSQSPVIKSKPSTSIGYKTLRDPPKSWNSQINSQIARVNQNVKAQQLANAAAAASQCSSGNAQGRFASDLKTVRPAKFFKGRNMPRYLGNPASGVKPMYQVQVSPEKNKDQASNAKPEKSEIKKHSIVKIDPKTLKPISEKAPDTLNLSNSSASLELGATHPNEELRNCSSPGDLKINISSVPIFNPLKLQQNSPKSERKSPKSPHSPKVKCNSSTTAAGKITTINTSCTSSALVSTLSSRQQRDKTSLTFTPPNPFIPNLGSPTLNPNQFLYPAGGYPSYDPRFMAACHSLWYTQRMAAAAAAGLVPPALPPGFSLNMGVSSSCSTIGQQSYNAGVGPKYSTATRAANQNVPRSSHSKSSRKMKEPMTVKSERSLEVVLEKINQSKVKELMDLKSADKKAMVRNGWQLQKKSSQTDNGDAVLNKKEALGALEEGSPNETIKMPQPVTDVKLAEGGKEQCLKELSTLPSRDQAANSTDILQEKHSKSSTNENKPNSNTDTKLTAEFQDEKDALKTEERLQDNSPVRDNENSLLEVAENGKSEASATLKVEKQQQPSENGISTCNSEIPKSDVTANDPAKVKEESACENSDKEILPNENSDKITSANDSGDGEKTSNV